MNLLDQREQKSPRFIEEEFDTIPGTLPAGDMLMGQYNPNGFVGKGIEFKLSLSDQQNGDYGIHTEPIERFHDECANKIKPFMIKNPLCDFHAIWWVEREVSAHEKKMWDHYCYQYYIWGHVVRSKKAFLKCIKDIQSGFYKRDQPYIKRSHKENTILAKMIRQYPMISSELAIELAMEIATPIGLWTDPRNRELDENVRRIIIETIGLKKDGSPKKLATDFIRFLEEGD